MNWPLVRAEARKLRSVRSVSALVLAAAAFAVVSFGPAWTAPAAAKATWTPDTLLAAVRGPATVVGLVLLVVGVLATAGERRHGTLAATLLVVPRRREVVAAKLVAVAGLAGAVAVVVDLVTLTLGTVLLRAEGVAADPLSGDAVAAAAMAVVVAVFYGVVGVGIGLAGRDQTAVLVAALVWSTVVENIVPVVLRAPELDRWMPGGAVRSLLAWAEPGRAAAMLAVVAALAVVAGTAAFTRRDLA